MLWAVIGWAVKNAVQEWLAPLTEKLDNLSVPQMESESNEPTISDDMVMPKEQYYYVIMKELARPDNVSKDTMVLKEQYPHGAMSFETKAEAEQYLVKEVSPRYEKLWYSIVERISYAE